MSGRIDRRRDNNGDLVIDNVLSSQPELGPSIPDGGYGWVVFLATLFFQLLIPSLLVSFGLFLAFSRMKSDIIESTNPKLWDHTLLHVPLFFTASWTFFDPTSRQFICYSTWPKLFATAGTCLICAGILFLWMGMTGGNDAWLFVLAGIVSGIGSSIQMAQCEILLAQYFRLKLSILTHLGHAVSALGFILAPVILGHYIFIDSQTQVILWYQAIILQGLILNLLLRKPMYLKSKHVSRYNYVTTSPDDEEDVFSKNSRELQIKVQNQHGTQIQTHEIPLANGSTCTDAQPSTSEHVSVDVSRKSENGHKKWVSFEEEEDDEEKMTRYEKLQQWENFDDDTKDKNGAESIKAAKQTDPVKWETFEDGAVVNSARNSKNLQLEMAFGNDLAERPSTISITGLPTPLFSDTPVNNNNTYSYDVLDDQPENPSSSVFMPATITANPVSSFSRNTIYLLQQPTFYKSLITVMTTKWSLFVFFALYPSFLFQEVKEIKFKHLSNLVGTISLGTLIFAGAAYWINVEKRWRPKIIWFLSWLGALGYFMISDYFAEGVLLFGAVQIVLSIAALQHVATPLLGLTIRGEVTKEYTLICIITGLTFLFFVLIDASFKQVFRLMALLKFFTGCLWLANYIYKRLR